MLSATSMTPYNAFKTESCSSSFAAPRTRCLATSPSSSELIRPAESRRTCHDTLILSAPSSRSPTVLPPRPVHLGTNGDVATAALDDVQAPLAKLNTYIAAAVDTPRGNETTRQGDDTASPRAAPARVGPVWEGEFAFFELAAGKQVASHRCAISANAQRVIDKKYSNGMTLEQAFVILGPKRDVLVPLGGDSDGLTPSIFRRECVYPRRIATGYFEEEALISHLHAGMELRPLPGDTSGVCQWRYDRRLALHSRPYAVRAASLIRPPVMSEAQDLSDLVATYYTDTVYQYFEISSLTLLGYHYVLTIEEEVEQISRQKFTSSTAIYLANRYLPLAVIIYQWSPVSNGLRAYVASSQITDYGTSRLMHTQMSGGREIVCHTPGASILRLGSLLRPTYVRYAEDAHMADRDIHMLTGTNGRPPGELICIGMATTQVRTFPQMRTFVMLILSSAPLLSRIPLVFADLAVIVITWKTQYNDHKLGAIVARKGRPSLATVLYHNGIKYFAVLTLLNIPQILTACFVAIPTSPEYMVAGMIQFIEPLTAILVASFLTDLRKAAEARTYQASLASFGSLDFRVVGSLGASLPVAQDVDVGRQGSAAEVEQEEIAPVGAESMDSWATESAIAMA
ncbi:hypothetical protein NUW54_g1338 [Trametes sanguinea]|uniref:Uncharacterized protein n=1 Tax=Trametes sanguinea TaxID=158606 RepID=A0ACC1Q6M9_9APHY|nr:hypothetical protein NUW54_g1338 [Trametes sanguinea]